MLSFAGDQRFVAGPTFADSIFRNELWMDIFIALRSVQAHKHAIARECRNGGIGDR